MLVLSRKIGEEIVIGDNVIIVVNRISGNRVSLGVSAPHDVKIVRGELKPLREQFAPREDAEPPAATLQIESDALAYLTRTAR